MNLELLKEKIPYQWRVQSIQNDKAVCVAYIDSRDVQEVLDKVCGPGNWQCDYKEVKRNLYCGIGIKTSDPVGDDVGFVWVWKWDCGTESNTDKEKGEASDSFKRAAVKWGVGRFLYDIEIVRINTKSYTPKAGKEKQYPVNDKGEILWNGDDLTKYINSLTKTTLYNHKEIGTSEKPLITNGQFKILIERVKRGDYEAARKAKEQFSFEPTQLSTLNDNLKQSA